MKQAEAVVTLITAAAAAACTGGTGESYGTARQQLGASDWSVSAAVVPAPDGSEGPVEPVVSEEWEGYSLGLSPGTWRYIGNMKLADPKAPFKQLASLLRAEDPALERRTQLAARDRDRNSLVVGDAKTGRIVSV